MRTSAIIFSVVLGAAPMLAHPSKDEGAQASQSTHSSQSTEANHSNPSTQANRPQSMETPAARNSEAAQRLLDATQQARNAVYDGNQQAALDDVNRALSCANQVQEQNNSRFVPIYSELSRYSVIAPIMHARYQQNAEQNEQPNNGLKGGQGEQYEGGHPQPYTGHSADHANAARTPAVGVQKVEGSFTSADLDIKAAKDHLQAAKTALNNGNMQVADAALQAVENGVAITYVSADLPLVRARENLVLARHSAMQGHQKETHAALREACQALQNYSKEGGQYSQQAVNLRSEISTAMANQSPSRTPKASQIETWWTQVAGWTPNNTQQSQQTSAQ